LELLERFIVAASQRERVTEGDGRNGRQRIECYRPANLDETGIDPARVIEQLPKPLMRGWIPRLDLDRFPVLGFTSAEIPAVDRRQSKRGVCFGERAVERKRACRGRARLCESIGGRGVRVLG
jgi:hypothetical protein